MNNDQFRKLIAASNTPNSQPSTATRPDKTPRSLLPSRHRPSSTSLTPRSLFPPPSSRKAKAKPTVQSIQGRDASRQDEESDETALRIRALEKQLKEEKIDAATFENLRDEITGGEVGKTQFVKGLDRKLLERVRRGEDLGPAAASASAGPVDKADGEVDDAFEDLAREEVVVQEREERVKVGVKGERVVAPVAGQKRSRDELLAEMKAQRKAAKAALVPKLGDGFRKIMRDIKPRVEVDERGREVLITVDAAGNVKRKVRKVMAVEGKGADGGKALGIDVSVPEPRPEVRATENPQSPGMEKDQNEDEDDDGDIFENAGHEFDPLADLGDESSEDEAPNEKPAPEATTATNASDREAHHQTDHSSNARDESDAKPHTYFTDPSLSVLGTIRNDFSDPTMLSALANSKRLQRLPDVSAAPSAATPEEEARQKRLQRLLDAHAHDRDLEDLDLGFGGSRFEDAEDMDADRIKVSQWRGSGAGNEDDEDGEGGQGGKAKRKRGGKKRKGDKNSAEDVLGVLEGRGR